MRQPLPPTAYKTYAISQPAETHFRAATCEEVDCVHFRTGWITRVPRNSEMERIITSGSTGRQYKEVTAMNAVVAVEREFLFEAGQPCFLASTHKLPLDKPATFIVRDGDRRGNPTGRRMVLPGATAWRDDLGEHLERVREDRGRG